MKRLGLILLVVWFGTAPLDAQKKEKYEGITWVNSYKEALAEARDRGCPVLAVITNNSSHDQITKIIHGDKSVIRATRGFVCVVAHNDYRPPKSDKKSDKKTDKKTDKKSDKKPPQKPAQKPGPNIDNLICPHYGTVKIRDLIKNYSDLSARFIRQSPVQGIDVPQHIYVDPVNDEELFRRLGGLTRKEMTYDLERAQKLVGKGISARLASSVRKDLTEAAALLQKGQYGRVAELLDDYLGFKKRYEGKLHSALFKDGDGLIVDLENQGQELIREAKILAEQKQFDKAKHLLDRVYREFKPFEISGKARKVLFQVRKAAK